jgi:hypothetical protein
MGLWEVTVEEWSRDKGLQYPYQCVSEGGGGVKSG